MLSARLQAIGGTRTFTSQDSQHCRPLLSVLGCTPNSSFSEKPVRSRLRRLVDWINLTGAKKVHSLIDKVYKRKNLEMAWEKVKANRGSGGIDGQNLATSRRSWTSSWIGCIGS